MKLIQCPSRCVIVEMTGFDVVPKQLLNILILHIRLHFIQGGPILQRIHDKGGDTLSGGEGTM